MLIFPAHPLHSLSPVGASRPDDDFLPEWEASEARALFDDEALRSGRADLAVLGVPAGEAALLRGWMLSQSQYKLLFEALADKGVALQTAPDQYRRAHCLPGWYDVFRELTPESYWLHGLGGLGEVLERLGAGPAVVKDFVKSEKRRWAEACYVTDVADYRGARRVAERFLELRGDDLEGGLVVRRFEPLGVEARSWWVGGDCVLTSAHPDTPDEKPSVPEDFLSAVAAAVAALGCGFVTVDLAERSDGVWRVVEVGDGQVSGRPASLDPAALVGALRDWV